jgi:alkylation response protein AidB-like acyl-CoA dehydrogenase
LVGAVLTKVEEGLVERAREFAHSVIAPNAAAWEATQSALPREVIGRWSALGLNALQVSQARGGSGASFHCRLRVAEAVAAECFASSFALNNIQGAVTRMEREGSRDQIARYLGRLMTGEIIGAPSLTEPSAGSDFGAIETHATKISDGWMLEGEKAWITNGAIADQLLLYAQTEPGSGLRGIASFIVDLHAPGIERLPPETLIGGSAIGAAGIRLHGVRVADADLFAPAGEAFRRALRGITAARVYVAAMICATVESALRLAVGHSGKRHSFGKPLIGHQGLRWQLADVATDLEAARLLVARAADLINVGADAQIEAAFAKKYAVEMALRGIAACMQVMGAEGLRATHPLGRHMIAARIAAYVDGTTEIQNERIGAALAARYGAAG